MHSFARQYTIIQQSKVQKDFAVSQIMCNSTINFIFTRLATEALYYKKLNSSIDQQQMRSKPIINQSNFNKIQKQPLFIVRPKPSQAKLQQPSMANRELKTSVLCDTLQKSLEQCMSCLEQQISEEKVMEKMVCQRIKEHLITFRQKYNTQQQGNIDSKKVETSLGLLRKQSSKYFTRHKLQPSEERTKDKENLLLTQANDKNKSSKSKSNKDDSQLQIQELELKVEYLSNKLQLYECQYESFGGQIRKLQAELDKQIKQKLQLKLLFQSKCQQYQKEQEKLCQNILSLQEKQIETEKKLQANEGWLKQRQDEIISFWQIYSK